MPQPDAQTVVIACPQCGTRYQLPYASIGRAGRTVQCAHCGQSWTAKAKPPPRVAAAPAEAVTAQAEAGLDRRFEEEEQRARPAERDGDMAAPAREHAADLAADLANGLAEAINTPASERTVEHQRTIEDIKAALGAKTEPAPASAPASDAATLARRQRDFSRRQALFNQRLPMARLRRSARALALFMLALLVGGGLLFRSPIVAQFPQLAGTYAALGLGVNVVGLEFRDVKTLKALQQGAEALTVDGSIASVSAREVVVPQVIVTLLDGAGRPLYEWSMMPKANELEPGETVHFETQLTAPPGGASAVQLRFAGGRAQPVALADSPAASDVQKG